MAMRAATMNPMSPVDPPVIVRESDGFFRKLILLLLLISAAVLWIVIWFEQETSFPLLLSTFFVDASLGVVAGFGARFVLRDWEPFFRYLVAILIAIIGMFMMGSLTDWVLGSGPILLEQHFADQIREIRMDGDLGRQVRSLGIGSRVLFVFNEMDWADLAHLAISLGVTALSLQAWRRTVPAPEPIEITPVPVPVLTQPTPRAPRARRGRRSPSSSNGRARVRRSEASSSHLTPSPVSTPRVRSNNGTRSTPSARVKKVKDPTLRPKKKRASRHKPKIQFALVEEHRCPYCLDAVTHNDSRGVKECEVCHTLHHADCWEITGVCQVPHLNT
jgi:hypothetical protein